MLAWLDIETTGLDPERDSILEIGFVITDDDLNEIARKAWVLPFALHRPVSDFIGKMHGLEGSGLLEECAKEKEGPLPDGYFYTYGLHAFEITRWLGEFLKVEKPPLCGNSINFDKGFFRASNAFRPLLDLFHYRVIDVSSIKEAARRFAPSVYESLPKPTTIPHRALADLDWSISELKHYRKALFDGR